MKYSPISHSLPTLAIIALVAILNIHPAASTTLPHRLWGTYYGGAGDDIIHSVVSDAFGNIYIGGVTLPVSVAGIATNPSFQTTPGSGHDAGTGFVAKFLPTGQRIWGTYINGRVQSLGIDPSGNLIVAGFTSSSSNIATPGTHKSTPPINQPSLSDVDAFLIKFDPNGNRLWGTYYGGFASMGVPQANNDQARALAVDSFGDIYLTGETGIQNNINGSIATPGALQTFHGGGGSPSDIFIVKFSGFDGTRLWGTYYGGYNSDVGTGIAVDNFGNVLVVGYTNSPNAPNSFTLATPGTHQPSFHTNNSQLDAILIKLNSFGQRLWATYFGGTAGEAGIGVKADPSGNIIITGSTSSSTLIATPGTHKTTLNNDDIFIAKFNGSNGQRLWGTYFGGAATEGQNIGSDHPIAIDTQGNIYLTGRTNSLNFPSTHPSGAISTTNAYQPQNTAGTFDGFITKFNGTNGQRLWGTYYGGSGYEDARSLILDNKGNIIIAGETSSTSPAGVIASSNAHQTTYGGGSRDGFVAKFTELFIDLSAIPSCASVGQNINVTTPVHHSALCPSVSIAPTNVPQGITYNTFASPPTFSGTFTTPGTYNFTVQLTDSCGNTLTLNKTIKVGQPTSLPNYPPQTAMHNFPYSFNAAGTLDPNFAPGTYTISPPLPPGLTLNASTGQITGTPGVASSSTSHTITLTDSCGTSVSKPFNLLIVPFQNCTSPAILNITASPSACQAIHFTWTPLPSCPANTHLHFRYKLSTSNTWTGIPVTSRPPISAGSFSLSSLQSGTYDIQVALVSGGQNGTVGPYHGLVPVTYQCVNFTTTPSCASVGQSISSNIALANSCQPGNLTASGLPPGVTFTPNPFGGTLQGTISAPGSYTITITGTSACGPIPPQTFTINTPTTPTLPTYPTVYGMQSTAFTYNLGGTVSATPATYSMIPNLTSIGLTLDPTTGLLSGTPTISGSIQTTVTLTDACSNSTSAPLTLQLVPFQPCSAFNFNPTLIPTNNCTQAILNWTPTGNCQPQNFLAIRFRSGNNPWIYLPMSQRPPVSAGTFTIPNMPPNATYQVQIQTVFTQNGSTDEYGWFPAGTVTVPPCPPGPSLPPFTVPPATAGAPMPSIVPPNPNVHPNCSPATWSATGLPPGLTINPTNGAITGTPAAIGNYLITVTLSDSCGASASQTLNLSIVPPCTAPNLAPSASPATCTSILLNWTPASSCTPTQFLAIRYRIGLNPWTEIPATSRPATPAGTHTLTALNGNTTYEIQAQVVSPQTASANPAAWFNVGLITTPACPPSPPTITGPANVTHCNPATINITMTATNSPTSWAVVGTLPAGLTLNSTTGTLSGNVAPGTYPITLTATNSGGTSAPFTLNLTVNSQPSITSPTTATGTVGQPFNYTLTASGTPTPTLTLTPVNPAPGLTISTATLSGTPTAAGTYTYNLTATNSCSTATATLTLTIAAVPLPPVINPLPNNELIVEAGVSFSYPFTATNNPTSFAPIGPTPPGTTLSTTGVLSGNIAAVGLYPLTIQANNGILGPPYSLTVRVIPANPGTRCFATYYGGTGNDQIHAVATDNAGHLYIAGQTASPNAIATPGTQSTAYNGGSTDAFIAKFDAFGNRLWGTYLGGTSNDTAHALAISPQGDPYLAGSTSSPGLGLNAFQLTPGSTTQPDAFLARLNPTTGNLVWFTYYGAAQQDEGLSVATDNAGNIYLTGRTASTTAIATPGTVQPTKSTGTDAFVAKFDPSGNRLWGTYFGGAGTDIANAVAVDSQGHSIIAGYTTTVSGLITGGHQSTFGGGQDGFIVKLSPAGNSIVWRTYYGGTGNDVINGVVVDTHDHIIVSGSTSSAAAIAHSGHQNTFGAGGNDAFVAKFNPAGTRIWGTYYGGNGDDLGQVLATDAARNLYLPGQTNSTTSIAHVGHQNTKSTGIDAFLVKLSPTGTRLWATYYGATGQDYGTAAAADAFSAVYLVGYTNSATGITTTPSHQPTYGGGAHDGFLVKLGPTACGTTPPAVIQPPATDTVNVNTPYVKAFTATNSPTSYVLLSPLPPGLSFSGNTLSGTPTVAGTYTLQLFAVNAAGPGPIFTFVLQVTNITPPNLLAAQILATHGTAGTFGVNLPLAGPAYGIDPRRHTVARVLELTFNVPTTSATFSLSQGTATFGTPVYTANKILLPIVSISSNQRYILNINNVNGTGANFTLTFGILQGDVDGNKQVAINPDRNTVQANIGNPVTAATFRNDINADGVISSVDFNLVSANLGASLP
ncbi:MAG: putative Ig domain-containing protein [Verrucomicrobiae bacterium]|nr:putative Ig domain-containing protein [Verrucomicrobiae bacterium]